MGRARGRRPTCSAQATAYRAWNQSGPKTLCSRRGATRRRSCRSCHSSSSTLPTFTPGGGGPRPSRAAKLFPLLPQAKHDPSAAGCSPSLTLAPLQEESSEHAPEDGKGQANACASGDQPEESADGAAWGKALWVSRAQLRRHPCRLPCSAHIEIQACKRCDFCKAKHAGRQLARTCLPVPVINFARLVPHRYPGGLCLLLLWVRQPVF